MIRKEIEIKATLAEWMVENIDIANVFLNRLQTIKESSTFLQYQLDTNAMLPYIEYRKFNDDAERYDLAKKLFANKKVSNFENAYFYILYEDRMGKMICDDFEDLYCDDVFFQSAKSFLGYLYKNVGIENIDSVKKLLNKITYLGISKIIIDPKYFQTAKKHYDGEVYDYSEEYGYFVTTFDFTDGNIIYPKKSIKYGDLIYTSYDSSFAINGIMAFPTNCDQFDLEKSKGNYKKKVRYPREILVRDLLINPKKLPGKTVDQSLYKMFPQLKAQIEFNRFYRDFMSIGKKQKKQLAILEKATKIINDESIDENARMAIKEELEVLQGNTPFLIHDNDKPNVLHLIDDGK